MAKLSDHFSGVSAKRLSAVETQPNKSNQHEFNGIHAMKTFLGEHRREGLPAHFIYIGQDDGDRFAVDSEVTWYDSRESHPTRSEFRLYFKSNEVMDVADEGDILIAALSNHSEMTLLVVRQNSDSLNDIMWLFGITEFSHSGFTIYSAEDVPRTSDTIFHFIAEEIGLPIDEDQGDNWLDLITSRFGRDTFPKTRELSALALETLINDISPTEEPDQAILSLLDREETMFRQLERHIVSTQLSERASGWSEDVDAFISFSLGVHNRRKSRAGHSLENHLEWIFAENRLQFERGARTEGRSKPDFLFPGANQYHQGSWPDDKLAMLGVKTSCKDRWRQVLNEAHRIHAKHLLTIQPGISENQTDEMSAASLTLVIPRAIQGSFTDNQRCNLLDLASFISLVNSKLSG